MSRNLPVFVCAVAVLVVARASADDEKTAVSVKKLPSLTFGLTGYAGADEARSDSQELQSFLTTKLGRDVTTRVFPSSGALASALASGQVDLAWMQPFTVVAAQQQGAVAPLVKAVRGGMPFYRGVLFTLATREATGLADLKGLSVAWVDKTSAAGYLFPRAMVVSAGFKPGEFFKAESFAGDHAAVCKAVLDGTAEVGATYSDDRPGAKRAIDGCIQAVGAEASKALKIIKESQPIPNDAIVARPGLEQGEVDRIKKAFLGLSKDKKGQALLARVFKADGFDAVDADDFTPVKFAAQAQPADKP